MPRGDLSQHLRGFVFSLENGVPCVIDYVSITCMCRALLKHVAISATTQVGVVLLWNCWVWFFFLSRC